VKFLLATALGACFAAQTATAQRQRDEIIKELREIAGKLDRLERLR
jgi:hypothetical protein